MGSRWNGWSGGVFAFILLGAEAELDERSRIWSDPGLPAIVGLELLHCGLGSRVPTSGGRAL